MKKFVTAVAVVALVAFAAPVFAATNPFMDVPMNHWAYDAIGQLAAHGILSGYPDGLYKGKQPTTRYEMASALARALAVVDMTKASKQDVEMLQKLVVEFHDELEALGVRVDDIEGKVNLLDSRLGGWKLSGALRLDIENESINEPTTGDGKVALTRARVHFDRWFGDPENPMHFRARLQGDGGNGADAGVTWKDFFIEVPFFYDTLLTVGKQQSDLGADYYLGGTTAFSETGSFAGLDSVLTDTERDKFQLEKQFGMGKVLGYVAHPTVPLTDANGYTSTETLKKSDGKDYVLTTASGSFSAWELFLMGKFQFNEQFGFDLGAQAFFGDNAEDPTKAADRKLDGTSKKFKDMWTVFAGLRFNFNENVAFKGIFYHQKWDVDQWLLDTATKSVAAWREPENYENDANHWRLIVDVKQEALKFTSLWLEYGQYQQGFTSPAGRGSITRTSNVWGSSATVPSDMKYWRIGLGQKWNEKWATHLFYYGYKFDDLDETKYDDSVSEWGLGVQYKYNPNVAFGLNFIQSDSYKKDADKDNVVRFRTEITF